MDQNVERSQTALENFRRRVDRLGLWTGAWLGAALIRKNEQWLVFLLRICLEAAGVSIPSEAHLFDATANDVLVRRRQMSLSECWAILEELMRGQSSLLSRVLGVDAQLCDDKIPGVWGGNLNPDLRERRPVLYFERGGGRFFDVFGDGLFEQLAPQLRSQQPPYDSLREVATGMEFFLNRAPDSNSAIAQFEVAAEIPIRLGDCFYSRARRGIEINAVVGKNIDADRLYASLTPDPRVRVPGGAFEVEARDGQRLLKTLVQCENPRAEVAVNLQFDGVNVGSTSIRPEQTVSSVIWTGGIALPGKSQIIPEWERTLQREFRVSRQLLRRALRAVLPIRLAEIAEWRIQESIALRDEHTFFAVVSSASVAEVLLQQRLAKITPRVRARAWEALRAEVPRLPRKIPDANALTFDHAIRLSQELGLLDGIDSRSIDLLRVARNEIHLGRKSHLPDETLSSVRASGAILATLDLAKRLASAARARPVKRATAQKLGGLPLPTKTPPSKTST